MQANKQHQDKQTKPPNKKPPCSDFLNNFTYSEQTLQEVPTAPGVKFVPQCFCPRWYLKAWM